MEIDKNGLLFVIALWITSIIMHFNYFYLWSFILLTATTLWLYIALRDYLIRVLDPGDVTLIELSPGVAILIFLGLSFIGLIGKEWLAPHSFWEHTVNRCAQISLEENKCGIDAYMIREITHSSVAMAIAYQQCMEKLKNDNFATMQKCGIANKRLCEFEQTKEECKKRTEPKQSPDKKNESIRQIRDCLFEHIKIQAARSVSRTDSKHEMAMLNNAIRAHDTKCREHESDYNKHASIINDAEKNRADLENQGKKMVIEWIKSNPSVSN